MEVSVSGMISVLFLHFQPQKEFCLKLVTPSGN